MKYKLFIIIFFYSIQSFAQDSLKQNYITLGVGLHHIALRDLGTSPLIYSGNLPVFKLGLLFQKERHHQSELSVQYAFGKLTNTVGSEYSEAFNHTLWLKYQYLKTRSLRNAKYQFSYGGSVDFTNNIRTNEKLMNNSLGIDFIQNIFAVFSLRKDISLSSNKTIHLGLFKIKMDALPRSLDFSIKLPVWQSSYRNGYAYTNQTGVIDSYNVLNGYRFRVWDGIRLQTEIGYNKQLKNRNAYRISYNWDSYHANYNYNQLVVAHHSLQFSLWYALK